MVRIFEGESVITRFLDMPIVNIANADTLFDALNECLIFRGLSWSNVMGYMSDNCNLMKGKKNSLLTRIQAQQPHVMDIGCVCHLANLCCVAGVKKIPVPISENYCRYFYPLSFEVHAF